MNNDAILELMRRQNVKYAQTLHGVPFAMVKTANSTFGCNLATSYQLDFTIGATSFLVYCNSVYFLRGSDLLRADVLEGGQIHCLCSGFSEGDIVYAANGVVAVFRHDRNLITLPDGKNDEFLLLGRKLVECKPNFAQHIRIGKYVVTGELALCYDDAGFFSAQQLLAQARQIWSCLLYMRQIDGSFFDEFGISANSQASALLALLENQAALRDSYSVSTGYVPEMAGHSLSTINEREETLGDEFARLYAKSYQQLQRFEVPAHATAQGAFLAYISAIETAK